MLRCTECGGGVKYDERRGEYYCETCGLVVEDTVLSSGSLLSFRERENCAPLHDGSTTFRDVYETARARRIFQKIRYEFIPEHVDRELVRREVNKYISMIFQQQKQKGFKISNWDCIIAYLFECVLGSMGYKYESRMKITGKERRRVEEVLRASGVRIPKATTEAYIKRMVRHLPLRVDEREEMVKEALSVSEKIAGAPSTKAAAAMVIVYAQKKRGASPVELARKFGRIINANQSTIIKAVRSYNRNRNRNQDQKDGNSLDAQKKISRMPVLFLRFIRRMNSAEPEEYEMLKRSLQPSHDTFSPTAAVNPEGRI